MPFFVAGLPLPQQRPRARAFIKRGRPTARMYDGGSTDEWKAMIIHCCKTRFHDEPQYGPLHQRLVFIFPRLASHYRKDGSLKPSAPHFHSVRPDYDNLEKCVSDALQDAGLFNKGDGQICQWSGEKIYGRDPGVMITIKTAVKND